MDRTLTSRFERKFFVSLGMAEEIRQWIAPHMEHDPFSLKAAAFRYPVCSLYLDSESLSLYHQTRNAEKNRFKLRMRTYGDSAQDPVFFEVKKRMDQIVRKDRVAVPRPQAIDFLKSQGGGFSASGPLGQPVVNRFAELLQQTSARPVVRVRYLREAFESRAMDPVRLTFDTQLYARPSPEGGLTHEDSGWIAVPIHEVILEVKYSDLAPGWKQRRDP